MFEKKGMINRGSVSGEFIYNLVKDPTVKTIVEIGTWNGLGSTKCIYDGIVESNKKDYYVLSLECNLTFHNNAKMNLLPLSNFHLIYGTITTLDEILPKLNSEVEKNAASKLPWISEEYLHLKNAPNVFHMIPEKIDFLILDGGEFSSYLDFQKLYKRSHFIYMDDTRDDMVEEHFGHILKNSMTRKFALDHPDSFKVLEDNQKLGSCGWFICEHLKQE